MTRTDGPLRRLLRLAGRLWGRGPVVHLYTMSWNEADIAGFFLSHYGPWVDRVVVYDDGSTDGTVELLRACPRVEVRRFARAFADSFVESQRHLYNHVWKESRGRADWVVITALDEHLHVPGEKMRRFLARMRDREVTYVPALGYQMIADDLPPKNELLCRARTLGAPFWEMNKLSLFDPNAIEETNFLHGRHTAEPSGRLRLPERDELLLLHYKYVGLQRTYERTKLLRTGLGERDLANGWGHRYSWSLEQLRAEWGAFRLQAADVSRLGPAPWKSHPVQRWWRKEPAA
jgi:glycosyltransferase involved in cell wall biosynthesis